MRKLRISADGLERLRAFLSDADVDFGCRAHARLREGRYETVVMAQPQEFERLRARRTTGVDVEDLGALPDTAMRLQMVRTGNRYSGGTVPKGFGRKE